MINFYSNKKNTLPRFFYRNYLKYIRTNNVSNQEAIKTFSDLLNLAQKSDFLKFTWNLPEYFKKHLDEEVIESLKSLLNEKREKKSKKLLKHVFPHVADEFALSHSFLSSAFDINSKYPSKVFDPSCILIKKPLNLLMKYYPICYLEISPKKSSIEAPIPSSLALS